MFNDLEFTISEETLLCAFDYAVGRKSYVVSSVTRDLLENADLLSKPSRQHIEDEINRRWELNELGHDNDRQQWVHLLKRLREVDEEQEG